MHGLKLPTLLVVTELPPVRYWIKSQLESKFFLINASTEQKALETVRTARLDFIIIDGSLEDCDPIKLSAKIRNAESHTPFPILLITGRLKKSYRESALSSGVTDFLSDELDNEELRIQIEKGTKAAEVRHKVEELSTTISEIKSELSADYLKNNGLLRDRMIQFLDAAKKENKTVAMLIAQIDEFAAIQSIHGPLTTEEILLPFSDLLNESARGQDIVTPSSDGQFIILLSNANQAETKKIAQQYQKAILKHRFATKQGEVKITASFAVSKLDATEASLNKTISAASSTLKQHSPKKNTVISLDAEKN